MPGQRSSGISLYQLSIFKRKWETKNSSQTNVEAKYGKFDQMMKNKLD